MSTASESRPTVGRVADTLRAVRAAWWQRGQESARAMLALGLATALSAVVLELLLTGRLGWLFDAGFVVACGLIALRVRPGDFTSVAAWPPVIMLITIWLLALTSRPVVARSDDSLVQTLVTGLAHHSLALAIGYALCLGVLGWRYRQLEQ